MRGRKKNLAFFFKKKVAESSVCQNLAAILSIAESSFAESSCNHWRHSELRRLQKRVSDEHTIIWGEPSFQGVLLHTVFLVKQFHCSKNVKLMMKSISRSAFLRVFPVPNPIVNKKQNFFWSVPRPSYPTIVQKLPSENYIIPLFIPWHWMKDHTHSCCTL